LSKSVDSLSSSLSQWPSQHGWQLSWFDRTGKVVRTLGELGDFPGRALSPDRKSAAVNSVDATGNMDLWIYDIARNLPTRFTFDPTQDRQPVWSRMAGRLCGTT
jgi:hypothetical protein